MAVTQTLVFEKSGETLTSDSLRTIINASTNFTDIANEIQQYAENISYSMVENTDGTVTLTRVWANDADYDAYKTACSALNTAHRADIESNGITITVTEP